MRVTEYMWRARYIMISIMFKYVNDCRNIQKQLSRTRFDESVSVSAAIC